MLLREFPEYAGPHLRALRRPARRPDGQQRSGPSEHRRGPRRPHGRHPHRPHDRLRRVLQEPGAARRHEARAHAPAAPDGPVQRRRRAFAARRISTPCSKWRSSEGVERGLRPLLHGRPRHAARKRRRLSCEQLQKETARDRRREDRDGLRPLLRDGSRQALGAHRARLRRHGARQRREGHRSGGGDAALLRKGRDRRVHRAGHHRRRAQASRSA